MNENRKTLIFIILLLLILTVVSAAVFITHNVQAQMSGVMATVRIIVCGNGIAETDEECDGTDLKSQTCIGFGYGGGALSCDNACDFDISSCTIGGAPIGGGSSARIATKVIFQGKAYPNSSITILKDGEVITVVMVDSNADFRAEITDLTAGIYTFGLWTEDKDGIKSIIYTLTFRVQASTITTVSGIYLPPTIYIDKTRLQKGEILNISGQTMPNVEVDVYIFSGEIIEKTQADEIGVWLLLFNTQVLEDGPHIAKARFQLNDEERSGFSEALSFYIGEGGPEIIFSDADFNNDDRVSLVDFSILLYHWGTDNVRCDLNRNGVVDLSDFSIMLYHWTG